MSKEITKELEKVIDLLLDQSSNEGHENINKSEWNEQAYWSPRTIKDTDEAFKLFNDWYYIELNQKGK